MLEFPSPSVRSLIDQRRSRLASKVLLVTFTIVYVILILTGEIDTDRKLGPAEYALIAFVVLFVGNFFDKLAEFSFGKEGISLRLNTVEERQERAEDTLAAIQIALTGLLTKYEYKHLREMDTPHPYPCRFGNIFFDEIRRLDSIGFLTPMPAYQDKGFNAIREQHEHDSNDFDLKQYVEITDQGKSYLAIRGRLEEEPRSS
jgi:hypothetical protein